jgi:NAD(P)H-hydrate epimerase
LFADQPTIGSNIIHPDFTISFQLPKLAFLQPSLHEYVGEWYVINIGLNKEFIRESESNYYLTETSIVKQLIPNREKFVHKGDAGRLLIVAGSKGKMGAAVLATQAGFRAGAGLINVHSPSCGINILQTAVPEAMVLTDNEAEYISDIEIPKATNTIAIGPGIDTKEVTANALNQALTSFEKPIVLDADALNILSANPEWIKTVPEDSILTPHPGEFERLVGRWADDFDKLKKLQRFCIDHKVNMVLKGAFSAVCDKHGKIHFNPTGNPGMATAGSGDVLTGIIGAFLAQGLDPFDSLQLGVFIHGLSGDLASKKYGELSMKASDIIEMIPNAIRDSQKS